ECATLRIAGRLTEAVPGRQRRSLFGNVHPFPVSSSGGRGVTGRCPGRADSGAVELGPIHTTRPDRLGDRLLAGGPNGDPDRPRDPERRRTVLRRLDGRRSVVAGPHAW